MDVEAQELQGTLLPFQAQVRCPVELTGEPETLSNLCVSLVVGHTVIDKLPRLNSKVPLLRLDQRLADLKALHREELAYLEV